jgi:hypothetical protein
MPAEIVSPTSISAELLAGGCVVAKPGFCHVAFLKLRSDLARLARCKKPSTMSFKLQQLAHTDEHRS